MLFATAPRLSSALGEVLAASIADFPRAAVVIDDAGARVLDGNSHACTLLGVRRGTLAGRALTDLEDEGVVPAGLRQRVADRALEAFRTRDVLRPRGRPPVAVTVTGWRTGSDDGRDRTFVVFHVDAREGNDAPAAGGPSIVGVVNARWEIERVGPEAAAILGHARDPARRQVVLDHVHPDDHADLLVAVGRVLAEDRSVSLSLRVRVADGSWARFRSIVERLDGGPEPAFGFVLEPPVPSTHDDRDDLAARLRRIADTLLATGIGGLAHPAARSVPALDDISVRQREILVRLLEGHRVPAIARELYLSPSTVRNHLAQLYRKAGVHSQAELLELFTGRR